MYKGFKYNSFIDNKLKFEGLVWKLSPAWLPNGPLTVPRKVLMRIELNSTGFFSKFLKEF